MLDDGVVWTVGITTGDVTGDVARDVSDDVTGDVAEDVSKGVEEVMGWSESNPSSRTVIIDHSPTS